MMGMCSRRASVMMILNVQVRIQCFRITRFNRLHRTIEKPVVFNTHPIFANRVVPKLAFVEMDGTKSFRMKATACIPIPRVVRRME